MQLNQQWQPRLDDNGPLGGISARPSQYHSQAYSNFACPMGASFPTQPGVHTSNFPTNFLPGLMPSDPTFQRAAMSSGNGWQASHLTSMGPRSSFPQPAGMLPQNCHPSDPNVSGTSGLDFQALAQLQAQQALQLQQMQLKLAQMQAQQQGQPLPLTQPPAQPPQDLPPTGKIDCGAFERQDDRKTHSPVKQDPMAIEGQGSDGSAVNNNNQAEDFLRVKSSPALNHVCHLKKGEKGSASLESNPLVSSLRVCDSTMRAQKRLGRKGHLAIHLLMLKQQAMLMEQLFDLHKLSHVQGLLQGMHQPGSATLELSANLELGSGAHQEIPNRPRQILRALMGHSREGTPPVSEAAIELAKQTEADTALLMGTLPSCQEEEPEDSAPLSHGVIKPTPTKLSNCEELKGTLSLEARRKPSDLAQEGDVSARSLLMKHMSPKKQSSISGGMREPPARTPSRSNLSVSGKEGCSKRSESYTEPAKLLESGSTQQEPAAPPRSPLAQDCATAAHVQTSPTAAAASLGAPSGSEAPVLAPVPPAIDASRSKDKRGGKPALPTLFATRPLGPPHTFAPPPMKAPKIDLHDTWYAMHFKGGANNQADPRSGPSSMQPPEQPSAHPPAAAITSGNVQPCRSNSPPTTEPELSEGRKREGGQGTGQVVRWWQDQVQTFGDIDLLMDSGSVAASKTNRGSARSHDSMHMKRTNGQVLNTGSLGQGMYDHLLALGPGNSSFSGSGLFGSAFQSGLKSGAPSGLNGLRTGKQASAFKALSKGNSQSQRGSNNHVPKGSKGSKREVYERELSDGSDSSFENGSHPPPRKSQKHHHVHQSTKADGCSPNKDAKDVKGKADDGIPKHLVEVKAGAVKSAAGILMSLSSL